MNTAKSLSTYTKITLGSVGALTAATHSDAAIVYFDVNPDQTILDGSSLSFGNINLLTETYSLANATAPSFTLSSNGSGPDFLGNLIEAAAMVGFYTYRLAYGDSISGALTFSDTPGTPAYWGSGDSGYLGLRMDLGGGNYNYGWAQVSVAAPASSITITGFAFEGIANTAILAGDTGTAAVPEPGQVAASLLLLAGIAGYFAMRRRAGASIEPTGLHALALGARGIEEFRKNKAA